MSRRDRLASSPPPRATATLWGRPGRILRDELGTRQANRKLGRCSRAWSSFQQGADNSIKDSCGRERATPEVQKRLSVVGQIEKIGERRRRRRGKRRGRASTTPRRRWRAQSREKKRVYRVETVQWTRANQTARIVSNSRCWWWRRSPERRIIHAAHAKTINLGLKQSVAQASHAGRSPIELGRSIALASEPRTILTISTMST